MGAMTGNRLNIDTFSCFPYSMQFIIILTTIFNKIVHYHNLYTYLFHWFNWGIFSEMCFES